IDPPKPVQGVIYNWDTTAGGSINSDDTFLKISASGGNQTSGHGSHLAVNDTITVRVAGACAIQLGGCQYGNNSTVTVLASDGTTVGSFAWNKANACGDLTTYEYNGPADTLTLQITEGGNTYLSAVNVLPGIEGLYSYDITAGGSLNLDDGAVVISATGGNQTSGHGSHLAVDDTITVKVGGACTIKLGGCQYGANSTVTVLAFDGTTVDTFAWNKADACGDLTSWSYTGDADTLTLKITEGGNTYLSAVNILY
ncbi:MAG: hypothetical protein J6Y93_01335, partial [Treponema sp.]|nr:hypothetical protein [Treponema sp.]